MDSLVCLKALLLTTLLAIGLAASDSSASTPKLLASVEVDRSQANVNEQILVTVRVAAPAIAFNVTKPFLKMDNVELHALQQREFDQTIDGSDYKVNEMVYALFVQHPSEPKIPALRFKATLPVTKEGAGSNPVISAETVEQPFAITAPPASNAAWLPAQNVSLNSVWSDENNTEFHAGEPFQRIVSIQVEGQHPAAIPDIVIQSAKGVKSYPDLAQLALQKSGTGLAGTRTTAVTLVAERAGTVTLPALNIDWWDINDSSWKQATLPKETLTVLPATESVMWESMRQRYRWTVLLLSVTTLGLILLSLFLWRGNSRSIGAQENTFSTPAKPGISEKAAWSKLRHSLKQQSPEQVRKDLLVWARVRWPTLGITRLDQLEHIDSDLGSFASQLNAILYAKEHSPEADYQAITQVLAQLRKVESRYAFQVADGFRHTLYPEYPEKPANLTQRMPDKST